MTPTATVAASSAATPAASFSPTASTSAAASNQSSAAIFQSNSPVASQGAEREGRAGDVAGCACDVARSDDVTAARGLPLPVPGSACINSGTAATGAGALGADAIRSNPNASAVHLPAAAGALLPVSSGGVGTGASSSSDGRSARSAGSARKPEGDLGLREKALAAGAAAVLSAVIMNPLDVVKTRLQAQTATASSHAPPPPPLSSSPTVSITSRALASTVTSASASATTASASATACCRPAAFCSRHPAFHPAVAATAASAPSAAAFCSHHRALFPSAAFPAVAATGASVPPAAAALLARGGQMHGHGDVRRAAMSVCCDAMGVYGQGGAVGSSNHGYTHGHTHGHAHGHGKGNVAHLLEHHHHHPHPQHHPYRNTWDVFTRIVREEGALRLWRGTGASLLMAVPTVGIYLPVYDTLKLELATVTINGRDRLVLEAYAPLIAGSVARALACVSCAPLELARTRMQAQRTVGPLGSVGLGVGARGGVGGGVGGSRPGTLATLRTILQPHSHSGAQGLRALWTGVDAQLARDVPFSAICWGLLEPTRRYLLSRYADRWEEKQLRIEGGYGAGASAGAYVPALTGAADEARQLPLLQVVGANFGAAMVAGSVAAAATHPLDVAKTRRQIQVTGAQLNTAQTLQNLWREGGMRALFAGAGPRILRAGPSCGIVVTFYEVMKHLLN